MDYNVHVLTEPGYIYNVLGLLLQAIGSSQSTPSCPLGQQFYPGSLDSWLGYWITLSYSRQSVAHLGNCSSSPKN